MMRRAPALAAFHDRWQDNALVMEKWFQMGSMSSAGDGIGRLDALMQHPGFDPKNPNKIRAILGAFMVGNTPHFHAADGSGYDYIARQLVAIDKRNPQVAARMALPLTRLDAYGPDRQASMRAALGYVQEVRNRMTCARLSTRHSSLSFLSYLPPTRAVQRVVSQ